MANTHKFIVKNGLRAQNVEFTDSHSGSNQISLNMTNTDTLNFEGDAGSLFSIADDLTGSVFTVGDISGLPIIDVNGDKHDITLNQFDGKTMIGGTDSGSVDSDILNVTGNIRSTKITTTDSALFGGNGSSGGVSISDGMIDIRTGTGLVSKIKFYCEASNAHFQTLQAAPHSAGSSAVIVLPTNSGTLLTTSGSAANLSQIPMAEASGTLAAGNVGNLPASKINSGRFDSDRLPIGVAYGSGGGGGGGSQNLFSKIAVAGQTDVEADATTDTLTLVAGGNMTITTTAGSDTITFAASGGGNGVTVQDEGSSLSTLGTTLNFVGSGVVASGTGATKTITISGGGGGGGLDSAAVLTVAGSAALNAASVDGLSFSVVSSMPGSPDSDTIYFVTS